MQEKNVKVTYRLEVPAGFLGQKWKLEVSGKGKASAACGMDPQGKRNCGYAGRGDAIK